MHYCELEEVLAKKRQRKSFLKSAVEVGDIPGLRLTLFCQTVRDSQELASRVEILKLPQMTRETSKSDLARTVSVLPNLKYVDLPDGVATADPTCLTLVTELQARCPNIRKMHYTTGGEMSLLALADGHWSRLEILSLAGLQIDVGPLRNVLASLPCLRDLSISDNDRFDDSIFYSSRPSIADFPILSSLSLTNIPNVTASGIRLYTAQPEVTKSLTQLTLDRTGITTQDLHSFLSDLRALLILTVTDFVSRPLGPSATQLPALVSESLTTLFFEVVDSEDAHGLQKPAESYYEYLAISLHSNTLPALRELYVREPRFSERLLSVTNTPPPPNLESMHIDSRRGSQSSAFAQRTTTRNPNFGLKRPLQLFSKGMDELEYTYTQFNPSTDNTLVATGGRPLSAYSASRGLGPQWVSQGLNGAEKRSSIVVGNGFGGFLAVPDGEAASRPTSRSGASFTPAPTAIESHTPTAMASVMRDSYMRGRSQSPGRFPGSTTASPRVGGGRSPSPAPGMFPLPSPGRNTEYLGPPGSGHASPFMRPATSFGATRNRSDSGPSRHMLDLTSAGRAGIGSDGQSSPSPTRPGFFRSHTSDNSTSSKDRKTRQDLWR